MVVFNRVNRNHHCNFKFVYLEWLDGTDLLETTIATIYLYVYDGCMQQSYQKPPLQLYICISRLIVSNIVIRNHHCNQIFEYENGWMQQSYQKPPLQLYICILRLIVSNRVTRNHHCNYIFVYLEWLDGTYLLETTIATLYMYVQDGWMQQNYQKGQLQLQISLVNFLTTKLSKILVYF